MHQNGSLLMSSRKLNVSSTTPSMARAYNGRSSRRLAKASNAAGAHVESGSRWLTIRVRIHSGLYRFNRDECNYIIISNGIKAMERLPDITR